MGDMDQLSKIVRQRLKALPSTYDHPDPDLLTAFLEQNLGQDERRRVLEHLSACTDCRQMLSLAMPEVEGAIAPASSHPGLWWRWPAMRWSAATAVATLLVAGGLFYARRENAGHALQQAALQQSAPVSQQSTMPAAPPAANTQIASEGPRPFPVRPAAKPHPRKAVPAEPAAQSEDQLASNAATSDSGTAGVAVASESADAVFSKAKEPRNENSQPSPQPGPAAPVSPQLTGPPAMMVYGAKTPRWRVSAGGELQRSFDVESWQTLKVGDQVVFRAVSANGKDVWAGGEAGALYHSPDGGGRWVRVSPMANGSALNSDITGIQSPDPLHIKLTTVSGSTWSTVDGGGNWEVQ
jgi:hypothetical protein